MKEKDKRLVVILLMTVLLSFALIFSLSYINEKYQEIKEMRDLDRNDQHRIEYIEKIMEMQYERGFTYKEIEYYDGKKYYVFTVDSQPEIEVRANYNTILNTDAFAFILLMDIRKSTISNYREAVTEYLIDKYQKDPVDISNMTIETATEKIYSIHRLTRKDADDMFNTYLEPGFEVIAIFNNQILHFNDDSMKAIKEELTELGLPD